MRLLKHEDVQGSVEDFYVEEETRLRAIFASSPDAITVSDLNGNITDCNQATLDMGGFSPKEEVIGKNALEFIAEKDRERAMENLKKTLEQGSVRNIEYTFLTKDGREYPAELSASVIKDSSGNLIGLVAVTKDITERKKTEEALRESEEKLRGIFSAMPDGVSLVGLDGRNLDCNDAILRLHGVSRDEYIGRNVYDFIVPEDRQRAIQEAPEVLEKGFLRSEVKALRKKGVTFDAEINVSLLRDASGKPVAFLGVTRDITERKKMEEKLREYSEHLEELVQKRTEELSESEKRYTVLVEKASDGVVIIQDGKIVFTNKKGAEIVGYSRDKLIGLPLEKIVHEKYRQPLNERCTRRLRGEEVPTTYELELVTKTGERVPAEVSCARISYQGRPAVLEIVRDIRERKRMQEERLRLQKLAAIGELATMVGHDLRNPLQSIENAAYYLNNELPRLPPSTSIPQKTMKMLQVINDSVDYANRVIINLQDFSAMKKPILNKTNINAIVKDALSQVEAPENVELITELGHLPEIKADKDMIKRVFLNLILNGIQAMENGGTLKVSTKKTKGFVEIRFKDTGVGISKENMKKIFTPFFTTRAIGMGMGLPICKKFVDAHGGNIEVESEEGKGSTFTVKLPIQQENGGET